MTEHEVVAHWHARPADNVAIVTGRLSGVVVVDVDPGHGGDPSPFVGTTPAFARTRLGGWHFYYRHPGRHVKSCAGPNPARPGVDVRGDGGYVVAPPSLVPPGVYAWGSEEGVDLASLPTFDVVAPLVFPPSAPRAEPEPKVSDGWVASILSAGAPVGSQRQALTRLAGYYAARRQPVDITVALLARWASSLAQDRADPWTFGQVCTLVQSIYEKDARSRPAAEEDARGIVPVDFHDFMVTHEGQRAAWMVEDWVPDATVGMVISPPGSFKTWLLGDLALSVAMGQPFLGRYPVHRPGPVVFIQAEDPPPLLASRLGPLAVSKVRQVGDWLTKPADVPLSMVTDGSFHFGSKNARQALTDLVNDRRPVLVVIDPLYAVAPIGNFFAEMAAHFVFLKRLRDRTGCSFIIAHHTKKPNPDVPDGREQLWGSNLMNAAIETGWQVRPAGAGAVTIGRHFKVSGNRDRKKFTFDIDLERVPAMVVEEIDLEDPQVDPAEKDKLDADHDLILAALRQEKVPQTVRALSRALGRNLHTVQRKVSDLVARGLLVRDGKKRVALTAVDRAEVT